MDKPTHLPAPEPPRPGHLPADRPDWRDQPDPDRPGGAHPTHPIADPPDAEPKD